MSLATDLQVMTGPTASWVHEAAAWVQRLGGLDAVVSVLAVLVCMILSVGLLGISLESLKRLMD